MSTDSAVIAQSMTEPAAFGELFLRHAPQIHRYAARRVGEAIADDVLSETFLLAFEKRKKFDQSFASARPWLLGIATNLIHRHRVAEAKTLRHLERGSTPEPLADESSRSDTLLDASAQVRQMAGDLRRLNKRDRDVLLLYAWEDLTYDQIGQALGIPTGTVRSRLNRARRILREATPAKESHHEQARTA